MVVVVVVVQRAFHMPAPTAPLHLQTKVGVDTGN